MLILEVLLNYSFLLVAFISISGVLFFDLCANLLIRFYFHFATLFQFLNFIHLFQLCAFVSCLFFLENTGNKSFSRNLMTAFYEVVLFRI